MKENKKSYFAIIPANVRYDKRLTPNSKLLYGELTALTNEKGYCWASNDYFAKLYEVSKKSISTWINQLKEYKYIAVEMQYKKGSKEIVNRYIRIFPGGIEENVNTPMEEKVKDNNTLINNTMNNTINKGSEEKELYLKIKKHFETEGGAFSDYGKQGKNIKQVIKKANLCFDNSEEGIGLMLKAFYKLKFRSGKSFWTGQPYLPSSLCSLWDYVKESLESTREKTDEELLEGII